MGKAATLRSLLGIALLGASCGSPEPDAGPLRVRVVGEEFEWHIRYPGEDGVLDTADDVLAMRDLHLPSGRAVELEIRSADYLYGFEIRDLGVNEIAVPELPMFARVEAQAAGSHRLLGHQLCGYAHAALIGEVQVLPPRRFERWLADRHAPDG